MNLSIKMGQYGEAAVTLDLGLQFAIRALDSMSIGSGSISPVPGYRVHDFGEDWVLLAPGPAPSYPGMGVYGPLLCVGRVDRGDVPGQFTFGISTEVTVAYSDLDYTTDPTELDLDARLEAARVLRLALTAFGVIQ